MKLNILQAFALAGGFREYAKKDEVIIIRQDKVIPVNYEKIAEGKDLSQNLMVRPGDVIVVP
jgi:polysaccharide export outer membrane protein